MPAAVAPLVTRCCVVVWVQFSHSDAPQASGGTSQPGAVSAPQSPGDSGIPARSSAYGPASSFEFPHQDPGLAGGFALSGSRTGGLLRLHEALR